MSVKKRTWDDGKKTCWEFCITIQKKPRKQYRKSGFKTKYEAQEAEQEAIKKYKNKGKSLNPDKATFDYITKLFLDHIGQSNEYSSGTFSNYQGYNKNHLVQFKHKALSEINPFVIQEWADNKSKILTPTLINDCRKFVNAAFNYAKSLELITHNPFENMRKMSVQKVLRRRFSIEKIKFIHQACKENMPDFYCIFCLAVFTGMRLGEYSALCTEDFDFSKNQVWINKQYTRRELKSRTKTESSRRVVDFAPTVGKIVKWHIRKYGIFSGFLFKGKDRTRPVSANWINDRFDKLLLLCGYPKDFMRVHDLRGQYVDIMHTLDIPTVYTSRQVGHARTSTTNDIYSQILNEVGCSATSKLEEKIFCEQIVSK